MQLKWEKPEIKDLNSVQQASGNFCNAGSAVVGAGFDCTDGGSPVGCTAGTGPL